MCDVEAFAFLVSGERRVQTLAHPGAFDITRQMVHSVRPARGTPWNARLAFYGWPFLGVAGLIVADRSIASEFTQTPNR